MDRLAFIGDFDGTIAHGPLLSVSDAKSLVNGSNEVAYFHRTIFNRDLFIHRGVPEHICYDNGAEFTATTVRDWIEQVAR